MGVASYVVLFNGQRRCADFTWLICNRRDVRACGGAGADATAASAGACGGGPPARLSPGRPEQSRK
jgi:hypothetical protein